MAVCMPLATRSLSCASTYSWPGCVRIATPATEPSCAGRAQRKSSMTSA